MCHRLPNRLTIVSPIVALCLLPFLCLVSPPQPLQGFGVRPLQAFPYKPLLGLYGEPLLGVCWGEVMPSAGGHITLFEQVFYPHSLNVIRERRGDERWGAYFC